MRYFAHIYVDEANTWHTQPVEEHLRSCAAYAQAAAPEGLQKAAYLAGLLHDMGKYTNAFQSYLARAVAGEAVQRGSVNHTFAGVRFAWERWHDPKAASSITCEIICFAIGGHHGPFDCLSPDGVDGFAHRITADGIHYEEAKTQFLQHCAGLDELDARWQASAEEIAAAITRCKALAHDVDETLFYLSLLARQLLATVIEGDRLDTALFLHHRTQTDRQADATFWADRLARVEVRLSQLPVRAEIDQVRRHISDSCRAAAERASGIYRLTVPTGGGKTLASLRYALAAALHGKRRIFFIIPLLSVLEQNAAIIRDYVGQDIVLEHHSNLLRAQGDGKALDENELLIENWDSPIVITTLVQLLHTLFAGNTTCIRRMAALHDSVIVIDEVQSVPRNMLGIFNLALNFLSHTCGATVVLTSATQPCLEQVAHRLLFATPPELIPLNETLWRVFHRTQIEDRRRPAGYDVDELADFAANCAKQAGSLLLICNTKAEARALFGALKWRWDAQLFHLSTAMCMAHRMETMRKLQEALQNKARVICVSTQLVEAGVDVSFGCVVRICAGMDNIVQAAGRCNRGGEFGKLCPVYIVNLRGESLSHLPDILHAQQATQSLLLRFAQSPEAFQHDLSSEAAISAYYHSLYAEMKQDSQDYPITNLETTLFDLLSKNKVGLKPFQNKPPHTICQAFQTAGAAFRVFEDHTVDVLVSYGEGALYLEQLGAAQTIHNAARRSALLKQAARYTVSLYDYEINALRESNALHLICDGAALALYGHYSEETGFTLNNDQEVWQEVSYVI